jgi:hypothetical protein
MSAHNGKFVGYYVVSPDKQSKSGLVRAAWASMLRRKPLSSASRAG